MPEMRFELEPSGCRAYIVTQYTAVPSLKYLPVGLREMSGSSNSRSPSKSRLSISCFHTLGLLDKYDN